MKHLNHLIKFFRITRKLQADKFDQGWNKKVDLERLSMKKKTKKKKTVLYIRQKGPDAEMQSMNRGQYLTRPQPAGGTTGSSEEAAHTEDPSL